ncbi:MAG TPA: excalibur calcium-binding domain-containing protein [Catenuloplanes sp.]|jgi:hypothetical protein
MRGKLSRSVLVGVMALSGSVVVAAPARAAAPKSFKNCTALNSWYKHGVGRPGARDRVRGTTRPVTTFKIDRNLYNANAKLDRDQDKVACEKR